VVACWKVGGSKIELLLYFCVEEVDVVPFVLFRDGVFYVASVSPLSMSQMMELKEQAP
jgi:hypothetical protein